MIYDRVTLFASALRSMISECCAHVGVETGGVLCGHVLRHKRLLVIANATDGGPAAVREEKLFMRDDRFCQAELERVFEQSCGFNDYTGEWHKHPCLNLNLSPLDVHGLQSIESDPTYATIQPVFLLVAMANERRWRDRQLAAYTCWRGVVSELPLEIKEL